MIVLSITVEDISTIMDQNYTHIRVYSDTSESGNFTTLEGTVALVTGTSVYEFVDVDGTSSTYYKTAYYGAAPGESEKSDVQRGGTADAYCTPDDIRERLDKTSTDSDATFWAQAVAMSRAIDRYCKWEPMAFHVDSAAEAEERIYLGAGYGVLLVPDGIISVSSVSIDGTVLDTDTYRGWPENAAAKGRPYMGLRRLPLGSYWNENTDVEVTGYFGYSYEIPPLIREAAAVISARLWKWGRQGYGDASANVELGKMFYTKQLPSTVKLWLDGFIKVPL